MTQNIVATWYKDGTPLDASQIQTSFTTSENGTTSLSFDPITRVDAGVYRVVVETQLGSGVIAVRERRAEVEFQVDVTGESFLYNAACTATSAVNSGYANQYSSSVYRFRAGSKPLLL